MYWNGRGRESLNDENLIPFNQLSPREHAEISRKGAEASNRVKKERKTMAQLTAAIMNKNIETIDELNECADVKQLVAMLDEDKTLASLMVAGQVKSAMNGNHKAFELLNGLNDKAEKKDESDKKYTIPITDITVDFVEAYRAVHDSFETGKYREIISKGGRGSIKSNFWSAVTEETIKNDPQAHVVDTRRYKTDLRGSVYNQFMKTVIRHGTFDEWTFTTSPMMAKYNKTGQMVIFNGCDKPISLKSSTLPFGYVKMMISDESDEMAGIEQIDNIEDTLLRDDVNAISVKIFNPPKSANNWMNVYTEEKRNDPKTFICHSYYYNVPVKWLGQRFFDRAEWFRINKPKYYANNYLGEVVGTGGAIFENLEEREITDAEIESFKYFYYGLDWGFSHPQAFIKCAYNDDTDTIFIVEEVRSVGMKQQTFARKIAKYKKEEIIADSEAPDKIRDYQDWGFDIIGATKRWKGGGRDYAWEWIQTVKKIVVDPNRTKHIAKELREAEHPMLKDGTFSSEYPRMKEDCIMALIYSLNRVIIDSKKENLYDDYDEEDDFEEESGD